MSNLIKLAGWSGKPRANVVFVHGLDGHPYNTWRRGKSEVSADSTFWPLWLAEDIEGINVFTLGYAASASGWKAEDMPMEDRVSNIADRLLGATELVSAPITIICHSLGGLITKQVLLQLNEQKATDKKSENLLNRVRRVVFLGTPHRGAGGATLMDRLRLLIWPSALSVAMVAEAPGLRRINDSYRTLARERSEALKHRVFFETQSTVLGKIVREGSADPGLDCKPVPLDANHFTIVKPRDRTSLMYEDIRAFISEHPAVGQPGQLARASLPAYRPERSFNLLGKAFRIASLLLVVAVIYLAASALRDRVAPAHSTADELTRAAVLAAISDDNERVRVAGLMFGRNLTGDEVAQVKAIRASFNPPPVLPPQAETQLRNARTPQDIDAVISTINVKPCGGSFAFQIQGTSLACLNGSSVPALSTTNLGPPLQSRDALVFHFTGTENTPNELKIFSGLVDLGTQVSVHLLIARSGAIVQLAPLDRQTWHAGPSEWKEKGITNLNRHSIGITLSNAGQLKKNPDGTFNPSMGARRIPANRVVKIGDGDEATYWESFTEDQIKSAEGIVRAFRAQQPDIGVLRHSDIAPRRTDPGPAFPIEKLR